jgi:hypothetical protein
VATTGEEVAMVTITITGTTKMTVKKMKSRKEMKGNSRSHKDTITITERIITINIGILEEEDTKIIRMILEEKEETIEMTMTMMTIIMNLKGTKEDHTEVEDEEDTKPIFKEKIGVESFKISEEIAEGITIPSEGINKEETILTTEVIMKETTMGEDKSKKENLMKDLVGTIKKEIIFSIITILMVKEDSKDLI